jgi:hypothetical protein
MIITPPDAGIAKYSLRALKKNLRSLPDCSLMIYQNGLSEQQEHEIASITHGTGWLSVSNGDKVSQISKSNIGKNYTTDQGATALRVGLYENYNEVWSRELVRLDSPLIGMIDSDFEIFDISFIPDMLAGFANDDKLAFFSTEHSQTQEVFETYSQTRALVMERWHTWFCIYRKAALEQNHDFSYKELRDEASGLPMKYDSAAWLQKLLVEKGWRGREIERSHEWKYIHYGAFSQNRTLSRTKLALYRIFRIMQHNGFRHLHQSEFASKQLRRIGRRAYRGLRLQVYDAQRSRYIFEQRSPARGAKVA